MDRPSSEKKKDTCIFIRYHVQISYVDCVYLLNRYLFNYEGSTYDTLGLHTGRIVKLLRVPCRVDCVQEPSCELYILLNISTLRNWLNISLQQEIGRMSASNTKKLVQCQPTTLRNWLSVSQQH